MDNPVVYCYLFQIKAISIGMRFFFHQIAIPVWVLVGITFPGIFIIFHFLRKLFWNDSHIWEIIHNRIKVIHSKSNLSEQFAVAAQDFSSTHTNTPPTNKCKLVKDKQRSMRCMCVIKYANTKGNLFITGALGWSTYDPVLE